MNIINIELISTKPVVIPIIKNNQINYLAIGLAKNTLLTKHKTSYPTTLLVIKGRLLFEIEEEKIELKQGEVYEIPIDIIHQVQGVEEKNVFTLLQQKAL